MRVTSAAEAQALALGPLVSLSLQTRVFFAAVFVTQCTHLEIMNLVALAFIGW
jgi:hypothetical protein